MSAPAASIDICNLTLDYLKQAAISNIESPDTATESIFARHYDATRRECLEKHPWNFAIKRVELTPDGTAPEFGYSYRYQLPADFIRLLSIGDDSIDGYRNAYEVEDGYLLLDTGDASDGTTIYVRYIYDVTDVSAFSPLFCKVLALQLAVDLAPKFSISNTLKAELKKDLEEKSPWAMSIDGQQRPPRRIQRSKFLARRQRSQTSRAGPNIYFSS